MLTKIKTFFRRLGGASFKRMFMHVKKIHKETGKASVFIFFDMLWCIFRYGVGYLDYRVFGFAYVHGKRRKTYMTMNHNLTLVRTLNNKEKYYVFDDKSVFDKRFEKYIGREWLDLRETDANGLKQFCNGRASVFAKQTSTFGGQGISKIKLNDNTDYDKLYKELCENKQYLIEETLLQHKTMDLLSPASINTVRMVTLLVNGTVHFMYALVRMSDGTKCVDNICSGGYYVSVDDNGVIRKPAFCDETGEYYEIHPFTKTNFIGFQIPYFDEAVAMCKEAVLVEPELGYVGWDVAITPNGPVLVEGNNLPSYDMCQNYGHIDGGIGILPKFKAIVGDKF